MPLLRWLALCCASIPILIASAPAAAVTIDFSTEDDGFTALINGQIVDPAFDGADLEFGNLFTLSSLQTGTDRLSVYHSFFAIAAVLQAAAYLPLRRFS